MKASIAAKLEQVAERYEELGELLSDAEVIQNQDLFRQYSKEYAQIEPVAQQYRQFQSLQQQAEDNQFLIAEESDKDLVQLAEQELIEIKGQLEALELELQKLLLPKDPNDDKNIFLEIRAGTGGDEAAIFAGDLFRMYSRYAETRGWQLEILSENLGEHGGYKEVIARLIGQGAFSRMKFESGTHRVQRVPETESQGRIHTSACTVAVLPELDEVELQDINPADLKVDTFRASGAGGQHVNKTDSAIRITHLPSGIVVECQDERSQHKNRARAMSLLSAKLLEQEESKQRKERAEERKLLVGSGDRSERIRTYNYPQGRVTDHRVNLTLYQLDDLMTGQVDMVIEPLINEYQATQLAQLAE